MIEGETTLETSVVVLWGIYEPPQDNIKYQNCPIVQLLGTPCSSLVSSEVLDEWDSDPFLKGVDKIAGALTLERIGLILTTPAR